LIREIERNHGPTEADPETHLAYVLERLIAQSPRAALKFLSEHSANGIQSVPTIRLSVTRLAASVLDEQEPRLVDELLNLVGAWHLPLDGELLRKLAKTYRGQGNTAKARELLGAALRQKASPLPQIIRDFYDLAKSENQGAEAHALLNQLVQTDSSVATACFAYRERSLVPAQVGRPVRIAILSSYTLDPLVPYLDCECRNVGLVPEFYIAPFNQYMQEVLQVSSGLYQFKPELILIALAIEDLFPNVTSYPAGEELKEAGTQAAEQMGTVVDQLSGRSDALIVACEFVLMHRTPHGILDNKTLDGLIRWIDELNRSLEANFRAQSRAYLLPLGQVVAWVGKAHSSNAKMKHMASIRLSGAALPELARYSMRYVKPLKGLTRKCIVLDLDGTLWGGLAGELGLEGIQLGPTAPGAEYMDFQEALRNLTRRGILLAICSKNNPDDVLPIIQNHPYMRLREEHFAAMRINWQNKAENLKDLAEELNIGLDAMVFIDDNPNERELIKQLLPEVLTVDLPLDPARYRDTLEAMSDFELLAITKEDESRNSEYQAMRHRRAARTSAVTLEEYLRSLEIVASIGFAHHNNLDRLVQMFNKTNQFNLTTRRYQSADFGRFIAAADYLIYTLTVSDRFGDHGLVGAAVIHQANCGWHIDSLLMSCRTMGLSVETAFLHRIYEDAAREGAKVLVGEFIPTNKNRPVEKFYQEHGFIRINSDEAKQLWELDIISKTIGNPDWINLVESPSL